MVMVFGFGNLHILLMGWGLAYCRTFCNEHDLFSGGQPPLLSTVFDRLGDSIVRCVWSLVFIYGICRLLFSLLALVECWVVLSCWISDALLIIFSLSVSVWWSVGVGHFVSFHFRLVKGVLQIDGKLCEARTQVQRDKGWKDRRIKSQLSACGMGLAYLAGVVFRFFRACVLIFLIAGIAIWGSGWWFFGWDGFSGIWDSFFALGLSCMKVLGEGRTGDV